MDLSSLGSGGIRHSRLIARLPPKQQREEVRARKRYGMAWLCLHYPVPNSFSPV